MKKLLVVFTALLVVAFATPVFATDDAWSGEFTFGGITQFAEDDITHSFGNLYVDGTFSVDDYNDVFFEFAGGWPADWYIGAAYLETDIGAALGLPVGLTHKGGWQNVWSRKYEVSGHAYERTLVRGNIGDGARAVFGVDVGMATIDLGIGFETGPDMQDYAALVTVPDIAGLLSAEAGYFIMNNDDFQGRFLVNVKAEDIADMIGVAVGFAYDTSADGGVGAEKWFWGVGVKADVMDMFGIGVSLNGQEEAAVHELGVDVNAAITDVFGVDVGVGLGLSDQLDTFRGIDPSVYADIGAANIRLGYLYCADFVEAVQDDPLTPLIDETVEESGYTYTAPARTPSSGSGLYLKVDIDF